MKGREENNDDRKRRSQKKEDTCEPDVGKVANHCRETLVNVFPMIRGSGRSKSTLAKAVGAEPPGQMRIKLHAAVTRNTF